MAPQKPIRAGIMGATGAVGQRFIQLLQENPWFAITAVAASDRSVGRTYGEACAWRLPGDCPPAVRAMTVQPCAPGLDCEVVFSAMPNDVALAVEEQMAAAGYAVFSNASSHRMDPDVPLLIPEVNPDHLGMIPFQRRARGWDRGFIVTNPNCSTIGLTLALKPLHDAFGVERIIVTTMQALSGAGYPGVPSLDGLDNVMPYIRNEEEKLATEPCKLLGALSQESGAVTPAPITISASCNRVATRDGHVETASIAFRRKVTPEEVTATLRAFRSVPHQRGCPSAIDPVIVVRDEPDRPQNYLDRDAGHGMAVTVGRVRRCEVLDIKLVLLSHNTIRGAAGGAILNAELAIAEGLIP